MVDIGVGWLGKRTASGGCLSLGIAGESWLDSAADDRGALPHAPSTENGLSLPPDSIRATGVNTQANRHSWEAIGQSALMGRGRLLAHSLAESLRHWGHNLDWVRWKPLGHNLDWVRWKPLGHNLD